MSQEKTKFIEQDGAFYALEGQEIIETVETLADGTPDWSEAGICDPIRGMGGQSWYDAMMAQLVALDAKATAMAAERLAAMKALDAEFGMGR